MPRAPLARLALALALTLLARPSAALPEATPEPDAAYRVVGVAADDLLNVRRQPGVGGEVVARLRPDRRGLVVTGKRVEAGGGVWWSVLLGAGEEGWVNARFLTPENPRLAARAHPLRCVGTEPFWSLKLGSTEARFETPEGAESWSFLAARIAPPARAGMLKAGSRSGSLDARRAMPLCSDGMSDVGYPYEVRLRTPDGRDLAGCCSRAE